jgi:DNA-binding CsgD family transcriptional regulator
MTRLRQRDVHAVSAFLAELYRPRTVDELNDHVLQAVRRLVPAEIVGYNEVDARRRRIGFRIDPAEADSRGSRQAFAAHLREHPVVRHNRRTPHPSTVKLSDFVTGRALRRLGLYAEVFRRLRFDSMLVMPLPFRPPLRIGLSLHRQGHDFERDRLIGELIRAHVASAYRNAAAWTDLVGDVRSLEAGLATEGRGIVVLDRHRRVRLMSRRAQELLEAYWPGARRVQGGLPAPFWHWIRQQLAGLEAASRGLAPPPRPLVAEDAAGRLTARLTRVAPRTIVLLETERLAPPPNLAARFGLSRREAEVLGWVARGKRNEEVAAILSVRPRTVAKHLEHLFTKLGVDSRTAAVAVALGPG